MSTSRLDINFEGYFTCRIATDPDPTNEERGLSGYTMALAKEDRLDQVIRLQIDERFQKRNWRRPMFEMNIRPGVFVRSVHRRDPGAARGEPWAPAEWLRGAKVNLVGAEDGFEGPIFESRNNTTGSDDTMSFVVTPFDLRIERSAPSALIRAVDYIDPREPKLRLCDIRNPKRYARRLTAKFTEGDQEVAAAIGVFDMYGYFRDRRHFLERLREQSREELAKLTYEENPARVRDLEYQIQTCESRIHQIDFWGERVTSKLQSKCAWEHDINGEQRFCADVGGKVDENEPWHMRYWFGGWDGDLLIGYMRGCLSVGFTPDAGLPS